MSKDKISSQEMVDLVASKLSVSKRVAEEFLKSLFAEIEETLLKGESVKIKNLGTFKMQWNEPRKSVNVQTGEVFVIDGYNKVTFIPDNDLKDAVNEPYSHLESVELDGEIPSFEVEKPIIQTPDSLKNITDQASEIKDILSEINALTSKNNVSKTEKTVVEKVEIPDYDLILLDEEVEADEVKNEPEESIVPEIIDEPIQIVEPPVVVEIPEKEEVKEEIVEVVADEPVVVMPTITETKDSFEVEPPVAKSYESKKEFSEDVSEPFILGNKKKKRKGLRFLIAMIVILVIVGGSTAAVYLSSSCVRCWFEYTLLSEENRQKMYEMGNSFTGWFSSIGDVFKKDEVKTDSMPKISLPDSVSQPVTQDTTIQSAPVDSLQQLFDSRREYNEFLGEEEISEGTRLTTIAQRYYGKKEFWVYIYEANRDNIVHPDRITPGTIVKVPRVDPRLIDKKNPRCIQKAKELHDLYVGKK